MKIMLKKLLRGLWWLAKPIHQPLKRKCREFLCACVDRQLKETTVPLLTDLYLRLDNLVREQDRLLAVIEHMQAAQASGATPGWHEAGTTIVPSPDSWKRNVA